MRLITSKIFEFDNLVVSKNDLEVHKLFYMTWESIETTLEVSGPINFEVY